MSHHKKHPPHVPPANRPQAGPPEAAAETAAQGQEISGGEGAPFNDQDAKRRLGDFEGAGEAPYRQPGGNHDADRHGS